MISGGSHAAAGGAERFQHAYQALRVDSAVQFDLTCVPFVSIRPDDQSSGRCEVHWPQDAAPPTDEQALAQGHTIARRRAERRRAGG